MVGDVLDGTDEWFFQFHSPHATQDSAIASAVSMLNDIRDEDIRTMQHLHPIDRYNEADYNILTKELAPSSFMLELVRRCGTDSIPLSQMVITYSEVLELV